jgi:autotransporter-associated beta strand protein
VISGTSGTANTGGGGGGGYNGTAYAGNGGSGIVIVRYGSTGSALSINSGNGAARINGSVSDLTTLTINSTSTTSQITGAISGATHLVNSGSGTLTLSGNNVYTGGTTVSAAAAVSCRIMAQSPSPVVR